VLGARGYAYLPTATGFDVESAGTGELLWIKRRYEPWPGLEHPPVAWGVAPEQAPMTATPGLRRQELLDPADPRRDFTMSLIAFDPGVGLPQIEIHDEEHGLWMTRGAGVYTLGRDEHAVLAGDFIYMAPYCPQGFAAGPDGAEYLLYKDVYRDGF
jgi:(S)-ureidoglycine aminohydrolase